MPEPRFRVTSCTGYVINPRNVGGKGKWSLDGWNVPASWQVIDTRVNCALVGEWRPAGRAKPSVCERAARAFAAALNEWDERTSAGEEWPLPERRDDARLTRVEYRARAKRLRSTGGPLPKPPG